jgi:DNA polymerase-3 subunit alpha
VLDNTAKVREYIVDAQRHGVNVLPPDINTSRENFATSGRDIRFGLLAIKNVGRNFAAAVISERKKSKFTTFDQFVSRLIDSDLNKRTVESMIKCGVFDSLGITRSSLMSCYEGIIDSEHDKLRNNISGQMDMFSAAFSSPTTEKSVGYDYPDTPEYTLRELLMLEKESSGMYFSGHLIDDYMTHISSIETDKISDILADMSDDGEVRGDVKYRERSRVRIAGIISSKRTKIVKNGDTMAFVTVEDRFGEIEVIVFAKQYKQFADILTQESAVVIEGGLSSEDGDLPKVLLSSAELLVANSDYSNKSKTANAQPKEKRIFIRVSSLSDERISKIHRIAALNPGKCEIVLFDSSTSKYSLLKGVNAEPSERVLTRLGGIFSSENVIFK